MTAQTVPRARVLAEAWRELGDGVAPLSNAAGLPLARTTKLVLDPLVVRPVQRAHLGRALLDAPAARDLRELVLAAGDDLRAAAAWFVLMKQERRARGITTGNPQDLYFQRAYELAHRHGYPGQDAATVAGTEVDDVHDDDRVTAADLKEYLTTPTVADAVRRVIDEAWEQRVPAPAAEPGAGPGPGERVTALLEVCAVDGRAELAALVAAQDGAAAGARLHTPGAARALGMSEHATPRPPQVGAHASKSALPAPFDRSVLERLFGAIAALQVDGSASLHEVVTTEARRSAAPWQLSEEADRVVMTAGAAAGLLDGGTDAARRLEGRWRREAFVRQALRLPDGSGPADGVREAFLRRLWVRLQGRELRGAPLAADGVWDLLDGAMRSVVLDRRDRLKAGLARTGANRSAPNRSAPNPRGSTPQPHPAQGGVA
ncbi:hypothetical protein [Isoptericola sp. NPDC057391]|uniref:hypothetical protein n=1 Tax=Isoptericola sp. NPDC057391 TaxID=3346117 RepID=UPI00362E0D7B